MPAKLFFFESVVSQFNRFLVRYQTDRPMGPFLCRNLDELLRAICERFVKKTVLDEASTASQLVKLTVTDPENHLPHTNMDPGFSAGRKLKHCPEKKFLMECRKMLLCAMKKLLEKCLLIYTMTRNLSCMDPGMMATKKEDYVAKFYRVLQKMVDLNQVQERECDSITREYHTFLDEVVATNHSAFKEFQCDDKHLDTFLSVYLKCDAFSKLWPVCKKLLILSHGQATVERRFSINSQPLLRRFSINSQPLLRGFSINSQPLLRGFSIHGQPLLRGFSINSQPLLRGFSINSQPLL